MAQEKTPRRLMRFKRQETNPQQEKPTMKENKKPAEQKTVQTQKEKIQSIELLKKIQELAKKEVQRQSMTVADKEIKQFKEQHNRMPKGKEFEEIAENIFQQIKRTNDNEKQQQKEQKRLSRRPGRQEKKTVKQEQKTEQQKPVQQAASEKTDFSLDMKELLGGEENEEFKLDDIETNDNDELKLEGLDDNLDSLPKEIETQKNVCPNCKEKTESLVFCPGCGTAFCPHCAKAANTEAGITKFICPKCGQQVKAQK